MNWHAEDLWLAMVAQQPGLTVEVLPEVDSTNSELMRRARAGHTEPVLLVAERQTAGRGRMGRTWHGEAGQALTFSLGLMLQPVDWSGLSLAVGLSLARCVDPQGALGVRLKWPNDLWVRHPQAPATWCKLAGILIETALPTSGGGGEQHARYCVVGVGINLVSPMAEGWSIPPLGLHDLHMDLTAPQVLAQVAAPLLAALLAFERTGFAPLQDAFNAGDALHNVPVTLSDGRQGVAKGVDAAGALQVDTDAGMVVIRSAEVSVRPV